MNRYLYRALLSLHPPDFRREFADEMLWIFDQAAPQGGPGGLILDGFISLLRQWVIRSGTWKVLAGVFGATVQLVIGALIVVPSGPVKSPRLPLPKDLSYYDLEFSRGLALLFVVLMLSTTVLCVLSRRLIRS